MKRAPATEAPGAADRRPALTNVDVNVNVNPLGDRGTQASDPNLLLRARGAENVADAAEDDREALKAGLSYLSVKRVESSWARPVDRQTNGTR